MAITRCGEVVRSNGGEKPYSARHADGTPGGTHASVRDAQVVVERASGGIGKVRWTKEDRQDGMEIYLGTQGTA